jgi:DNA-binding NtrC family response regulator
MQRNSADSRRDSVAPFLVVGRTAKTALTLLNGCGFSWTPCPEVRDALKLLHKGRHRAVLCDLDLTGVDGKKLLNTIRTDFPEVAVVAVTRPGKLRHGILAMIAGASGYIQTPLQPAEVAACLLNAMKRKQLDVALRA